MERMMGFVMDRKGGQFAKIGMEVAWNFSLEGSEGREDLHLGELILKKDLV